MIDGGRTLDSLGLGESVGNVGPLISLSDGKSTENGVFGCALVKISWASDGEVGLATNAASELC